MHTHVVYRYDIPALEPTVYKWYLHVAMLDPPGLLKKGHHRNASQNARNLQAYCGACSNSYRIPQIRRRIMTVTIHASTLTQAPDPESRTGD